MSGNGDIDRPPEAPRRLANTATLCIGLSGELGSSIDFDAEKGELSASCSVQGRVWNTDSVFRSIPVQAVQRYVPPLRASARVRRRLRES